MELSTPFLGAYSSFPFFRGLQTLPYVYFRRYDICELLLKSNAKVQAKSKHGVTAMTVAIEQHNPYMVRLLVQFGYKLDKSYT